MAVAAANVQDRGRQRQILVIGRFDRTQEGAKVRQLAQLQKEEVLHNYLLNSDSKSSS